jgi:hypothetical protein
MNSKLEGIWKEDSAPAFALRDEKGLEQPQVS